MCAINSSNYIRKTINLIKLPFNHIWLGIIVWKFYRFTGEGFDCFQHLWHYPAECWLGDPSLSPVSCWKVSVAKNLSVASTCTVLRLNRASNVQYKSMRMCCGSRKRLMSQSSDEPLGDPLGPWRLDGVSPMQTLLTIISPPLPRIENVQRRTRMFK